MMVGRHFIHARPAPPGIHRQLREARHAIRSEGQDLLDEGGIEIGAEARLLLAIGPGHQQTHAFLPEMPASGHVDDHGQMFGQSWKRLSGNEHAAERFDRQFGARHARDTGSPRPGCIDDGSCGNGPVRGFDAGDFGIFDVNTDDLGAAP
jgi:hypothetical protein